jgi:hypothetical protein
MRAQKGLLTMSRPKDTKEKLARILNAWRTLAPDKSFGGMTLAQFEAACAPSSTTRALIAELEDRLAQAHADRDAADTVTASKLQLVVNGILADPTEGADSALYEAIGYTRKSERKTGLTRKRKEPEKK